MTDERHRPAPILAILGLPLVAATLALGEHLPIRSYTSDDGLSSDWVSGLVRDDSGYLWFLTSEGLCRFDGQAIECFGPQHGIPSSRPRDLLQTNDGVILVAMWGGVYWFDPTHSSFGGQFRMARPMETGDENLINALFEDASGRVWCATRKGLFEMERDGDGWRFRHIDIMQPANDLRRNWIDDLLVRSDGSLWLATPAGLIWISANGSMELFDEWSGLPYPGLVRLTEDREGRVWGAAVAGFVVLESEPVSGRPILRRSFAAEDGIVDPSGTTARVFQVFQASDGEIWVASEAGLIQVLNGDSPDEATLIVRNKSHGLTSVFLWALAEDPEGNLWLGTSDNGVMKFDRRGLVTYDADDGLPVIPRKRIFEDETGTLCVVGGSRYHVFQYDGKRFSETVPELPGTESDMGWGNETVLQDSRGEWWFGTFRGLVRFPRSRSASDLAGKAPSAHYTERDGLLSDGVFSLYEDARGDLWIGGFHYTVQERNGLQRWDRASDTFHWFDPQDGVPHDAATALLEDASGNLWVGFYAHGVGRFREGAFELFDAAEIDGAPRGYVSTLHLDAHDRLWIGTSCCGAIRVDDPASATPTFRAYGTGQGLTTNSISCVSEDRWGRLYFGSDRGVDRLDPDSGGVRHFSRLDGLASNHVWTSHADHDGVQWFGTTQGLSRLDPRQDPQNAPPPVRIRSVSVAGRPWDISPLGESEVGGLRLPASNRQLEVEFAGLSFLTGEKLRYQYRLEGDQPDWSAPSTSRSVHFVSLSPGHHRLLLRAVDADNTVSQTPARVMFYAVPPVWMRWWFVVGVSLFAGAAAYQLHRFRMRRVLELERVRTRIATDLHDDIGASLSQVAILSEVASHKMDESTSKDVKPLLGQVAATAREVVDSMGDIVWAINPERDRASDLIRRMRSFASNTLASRGVTLRFRTPEDGLDRPLDLDLRRQVYLIFKEAVNNVARHSGCTATEIVMELANGVVRLEVSDNGKGFDINGRNGGQGLASMRRRTLELGGQLEIDSRPGAGTRLRLELPLQHRAAWRRRRA
jgi:ligand-binding sensor domain-containing protein/signal transduction histidine kinase